MGDGFIPWHPHRTGQSTTGFDIKIEDFRYTQDLSSLGATASLKSG
jgi:hypothetical protein